MCHNTNVTNSSNIIVLFYRICEMYKTMLKCEPFPISPEKNSAMIQVHIYTEITKVTN